MDKHALDAYLTQSDDDVHPDWFVEDSPTPEPLTPEERYDTTIMSIDHSGTLLVIDALRAMIASLDAEIGRQSVTINQLERRLEEVIGIVRLIGGDACD